MTPVIFTIRIYAQWRWLVVLDQVPLIIILTILVCLYGTALASYSICVVCPRMIASSLGRYLRPRPRRLPRIPPRYFFRPRRVFARRPQRLPHLPRLPTRYYPFYGVPRTPGQPRFHNWVRLFHFVLEFVVQVCQSVCHVCVFSRWLSNRMTFDLNIRHVG